MDIVEFLSARIGEDEENAQSRSGSEPIHETGCYYYNYTLDAGWFCDCEGPIHAAKEAAAKRAILDGSQALIVLAQIYSDHPEFDVGWISE